MLVYVRKLKIRMDERDGERKQNHSHLREENCLMTKLVVKRNLAFNGHGNIKFDQWVLAVVNHTFEQSSVRFGSERARFFPPCGVKAKITTDKNTAKTKGTRTDPEWTSLAGLKWPCLRESGVWRKDH